MTQSPDMPGTGRVGDRGLLTGPVSVINVGLEGFVADLEANNVPVLHVEWAPPAGGDPRMAALLARLGV